MEYLLVLIIKKVVNFRYKPYVFHTLRIAETAVARSGYLSKTKAVIATIVQMDGILTSYHPSTGCLDIVNQVWR